MDFELFANAVRETLDYPVLTKESMQQCLCVGDTAVYHYEEISVLLEQWVSHIDKQLAQTEKYTDQYIQLMEQRIFTFEEYKQVFDGNISPDYFYQFPVFEFLMIQTNSQRDLFTLGKKDDFQSYVNLLTEYRHLEVVDFLFRKITVPVSAEELKKHSYISGKTGSGKSELMKSLFYQMQRLSLASASYSMVLIDPHGDLAEEIRNFDLNKDNKKLIYVDPYYKKGWIIILNAFSIKNISDQHIDVLSQELAKMIQELIPNTTLSNQMEALLIPCIATLLRLPKSTIRDLQRFMDDDQNQDLIDHGLKSTNAAHRSFFEHRFHKPDYRTTKHSIYTKLQSLLNSQIFYNLMVGESTFDLEKALNNGKTVLFNLAQGKMGPECSVAYGRFLVTMILGIALRRAETKKEHRRSIFLFIDEFQNYISQSIEKILTEARKYGLHLVLANQNFAQITDKKLQEAILSNTNIKLVGKNAISTLKVMAQEINVKLERLQEMKKHHFQLKVGDKTTLEIKAPSFLIHNAELFSLNKEEYDSLKNYLLNQSGYYKPIQKEKKQEQKANGKSNRTTEKAANEAPKPKFKLRK